jgi:hypothetical protein
LLAIVSPICFYLHAADTHKYITNWPHNGDYLDALRRVAKEANVSLIDLHAMSKTFHEALGAEGPKRAFAPGGGTHYKRIWRIS